MSNLFWLTDAQMERLKPFFPKGRLPNFDTSERDLSGFCWPTFEVSMG